MRMSQRLPLLALPALSLSLLTSSASALTLARDGASDYVIVVSADASPSERHGADELQRFLREISGAELPIVGDDAPLKEHEIVLGDSAHLQQLGVELDWAALGGEGFTIWTVGERLVIAGGRRRGTMYGVYTFLEEHLGCRWFSSKVSRIPRSPTIELPEIDDTQVPVLEYREPFYYDAFDADWAARNKANSRAARLDEQRGGKITYYPFVHTFDQLIPPAEYFGEHPEYFAEVNGTRVRERTQLCLTNPDVLRLSTAKVRQWIDEHPGVNIISVSQNDWGNYCQCANCRAIAEAEGSQAGPVVAFVNQIADAIKDDYPEVAIDTLAYHWSRHPPKSLRPLPNVIIRLCSIECCFSHPLATCDHPQNVSFRDDIIGWSKICNRLYIWDYVTSFAHYLNPFPNWDVLQPNIRFFVDHGAKGIFEEGNYNSPGGEFAELRAYVMAKCLWDPDYDPEKAMDEFLEGYYGTAVRPIREYIDLLTAKVRDENIHLHIWANPNAPYLTDEILERANALFDEAERLAEADEEVLRRVHVARLPLQYVALNRWQAPAGVPSSVRNGRYGPPPDPAFSALADRFFATVDREGIISHREGRDTMPAFREAILTRRDGVPAVSLADDHVAADIVPSLGARLVGLRAMPQGEELAANGVVYTVSLSRSAAGAGSSAEFDTVPGAGLPAGTTEFGAELEDGLRVQRRYELPAEDAARVDATTTVENLTDQTKDLLIHATVQLDLGPADATVLTTPDGPMSLAIPEDQTVAHYSVAPATLRSGKLLLANGETPRGLLISVGADSADWATVTTSTGSVPVRVDLYRHVGNLEAGQSVEVVHSLAPQTLDEVVGARKPREHRSGVVEIQDDQFGLYKEGTLSEYVRDETASDGWAARQLGSDKEWSIQYRFDPGLFEPEASYRVYAVVKIDRTGDQGKAFDFGVYDTVSKQGVLYGNRGVADMADGEWQTVEFGSVVPQQGRYVWTAPPQNGANVAWVYVDRLYFVRD